METKKLTYDGAVHIATGRNRMDTRWKNSDWTWADFIRRLSTTQRTEETVAEFARMPKSVQAEKKDVGGFVAGHIEGGRRKAGSILSRSMITLDMDYAPQGAWEAFTLVFGCAAVCYSTHSHRPDKPRLRFILPMSRETDPTEYEAAARAVAAAIGIDYFDDTTYQPERLMFWPSTSRDGEYFFRVQDGPWLDVDEILKSYRNWRDASEWPVSSRVDVAIKREIKKQGDPLEKGGIVGAFCRTYGMHDVIAAYLADEYVQCDNMPDRYTYTKGSTAAGLVIYEDRFAYSHHSTDPTCSKLCNAFDLVRLHLYGDMDENWTGTDVTKSPSYRAMCDRITQDRMVAGTIAREKAAEAASDFEGIGDDGSWLEEMDITRKGEYENTPGNYELVLQHDVQLAGKIAIDEFSGRVCVRGVLPWRKPGDTEPLYRDDDEAGLYLYMSREPYRLTSKSNLIEALKQVSRQNAFHPVREYLGALAWDGTERLDTVFIDYMGVEDTAYTRAATRKVFTAAVARIYRPGTKFDYMPVLVGAQGVGKSRLLARLAVRPEWFTDNFSVDGKEAAENIQGKWIVEAAELSGFKKSETTAVKAFITRTNDYYRAAFERYALNRPRQCVFFGTTNEYRFLRDETGDRRFWPMEVDKTRITKTWKDLSSEEVAQIWAEAVYRYGKGEPLYLSPELEAMAKEKQSEFSEVEERMGIIQEYLDRPLPENWTGMGIPERVSYMRGGDQLSAVGVVQRSRVCVMEIWCECFGRQKGDLRRSDSNEICRMMWKMPGWKMQSKATRLGPYGVQKCFERNQDSVISDENVNSIF